MGGNTNTAFYSLADVIVTVGPFVPTRGGSFPVPAVDVSGYSDGGGVEFSIEENLHTRTGGADGHQSISEVLDSAVVATITLAETSEAYGQLGTMLSAQKQANGLGQMPFQMSDPNNGDEIDEEIAIFQTAVPPNKTGEASDREFNLILPQARESIINGVLNLGDFPTP